MFGLVDLAVRQGERAPGRQLRLPVAEQLRERRVLYDAVASEVTVTGSTNSTPVASSTAWAYGLTALSHSSGNR